MGDAGANEARVPVPGLRTPNALLLVSALGVGAACLLNLVLSGQGASVDPYGVAHAATRSRSIMFAAGLSIALRIASVVVVGWRSRRLLDSRGIVVGFGLLEFAAQVVGVLTLR